MEIANGMKAMDTYNAETELSVANCPSEPAVDVVFKLDENEPEHGKRRRWSCYTRQSVCLSSLFTAKQKRWKVPTTKWCK